MENESANTISSRPSRRAKVQAMETIREYTRRQAAARSNRVEGVQAPKYDEYGLLDTDSDDSDYAPSDSEGSEVSVEEVEGSGDEDDNDEDEDDDEDDDY